MTHEEFIYLTTPEAREAIERNIDADPLKVALDKRLPRAALISAQVKYLQRARRKLPSLFAARCVIPSLAYEQSSAEEVAAAREWAGALCVDLTCGLGVDALYLSKRFEKVVTIERDPLLAEVARYNFGLLGAHNIEVVCASAEDFVGNFSGRADLIFADPDRRGTHGEKLYRLQDCSPDMVGLMPLLSEKARAVAIKCSPLFDVDAAKQLFGTHTLCRAVSLDGECKEVVIEVDPDIDGPLIEAVVIGKGSVRYNAGRERPAVEKPDPETFRYLTIPDVALQKARIAVDHFRSLGAWIENDNGYAFSTTPPQTDLGRTFKIVSIQKFTPKAIARQLRTSGIITVDILTRNFSIPAADIARQLGIRQGGTHTLAFTTLLDEKVCIAVNK